LGSAILGLFAWAVGKWTRGQIILGMREERPTWLQRNRDALVVQLLVGVALIAVGYLLGRAQ